MKKSNLSFKIVFPSLLAVLLGIALTVSIILNILISGYTDLSKRYIDNLTENYARQIDSKMTLTLNTAETLAVSVAEEAKQTEPSRDTLLQLVADILKKNDGLVGIGVGFEPNAFDGNDADFKNTRHSDDTGRFVPYTFRDGGGTSYTVLEGYDDPGPDGSWYSVPKATKQTFVTDPYWYNVGSEKHLIFTCVAPVLDDRGNFIAMVGFDTLVDSLNSIVQNTRIFDTGYLSLVSPDGTIAYHPTEAAMGNPVSEIYPSEVANVMDQVRSSGELLTVEAVWNQTEMQYNLFPISVGESSGKWIVVTNIPISEIDQVKKDSIFAAVTITIALTLLIALVIILVLRIFVLRPVRAIKQASDSMAEGSLNIQIPYRSTDELGQLAENIQKTSSTISTYIENISQTLGAISQGDMTTDIQLDYIGDFIPIKTSMTQILHSLNDTLRQIRQSARQVAGGSEQMASGAQALSQGAVQQASSVEELASTLELLSQQARQTAEIAVQASEKSHFVGSEVSESNNRMQALQSAMADINSSSAEIEKIIKTIEDIAFQTNILALNAAVEAARAGAAGKGFAVVADEVRNLASKSAEASHSTAELIDRSLEAVRNGTRIADETARALVSVVEGVEEVADNIGTIALASDQQSSSIGQITDSINQISNVVQTNSATAEQSAATSEELSAQSQLLDTLVTQFRLRKEAPSQGYSISSSGFSLSPVDHDAF